MVVEERGENMRSIFTWIFLRLCLHYHYIEMIDLPGNRIVYQSMVWGFESLTQQTHSKKVDGELFLG